MHGDGDDSCCSSFCGLVGVKSVWVSRRCGVSDLEVGFLKREMCVFIENNLEKQSGNKRKNLQLWKF